MQRVWLLSGVARLYSGTLVKRPATIGTRDLAVTEVITQQPGTIDTKARKFGGYGGRVTQNSRSNHMLVKKATYHVENDLCFIISKAVRHSLLV